MLVFSNLEQKYVLNKCTFWLKYITIQFRGMDHISKKLGIGLLAFHIYRTVLDLLTQRRSMYSIRKSM
jgi:hypothetical protein